MNTLLNSLITIHKKMFVWVVVLRLGHHCLCQAGLIKSCRNCKLDLTTVMFKDCSMTTSTSGKTSVLDKKGGGGITNIKFVQQQCIRFSFLIYVCPEKGSLGFMARRHHLVLAMLFSFSLRRSRIGSFPSILKMYLQETSKPPQAILERYPISVILHVIVPPCIIKYLARREISLGICRTVITPFLTATLCLSPNFSPSISGSVSRVSPVTGTQYTP